MGGIQQYTSSLFIQSGSIAKFESGLEVSESIIVDGNVTASGYFDLQGNEFTGGGGAAVEFFAGSGSGVSQSSPASIDIFKPLVSGETITDEVVIHTTHSSTFFPNHYVFVKITDEFETKQSGSSSNYNIGPLTTGVYRYLVYGAQTGSDTVVGETHQVYTTVFIKGFFNEPPNIDIPTAPTLSMEHDAVTGSLILHFTNSQDPNSADSISFFTASRLSADATGEPDDTTAQFKMGMSHSNFEGNFTLFSNPSLIQTASIDLVTHNGLGKDIDYANTLFFTASVSEYNIIDNNGKVRYENRDDEQEFRITLKDENETVAEQGGGESGVSTQTFTLQIKAPPTASISNIRTVFEQDGFTGNEGFALTHSLLYDRTESLSSASISNLNDRYTSSLIRLSTRAELIPPPTFTPPSNHTASIRIQSSSDGNINFNDRITKKLSFFQFRGGEKTSSNHGAGPLQIQTPTESLGFTSFVFKPDFSSDPLTQSIHIGANTTKNDLNRTTNVLYGINNHYEAFTTTPNVLTIHNIPKIELSDIVVEVESGSFGSNIGHSSLTSSLLYGYTSSLSSSQTQSLLIDLIPTGSEDATDHPLYFNYISSSVIRLRIRAKIIEPFGPDHKPFNFILTGSNENNLLQLSHSFIFATNSVYTASSFIEYSNEDKPRLVGIYTSSWHEFNFPTGSFTFTTQITSESHATSNIENIITTSISMSNYSPVLLDNLIYEVESSGLTGSGLNDANMVTDTARKVLYGHNHTIFGNSSSYESHPNAQIYASHSALRMRVRGKITEPFGPATSKLNFNFNSKGVDTVFDVDPINDAFTIDTTSSFDFNDNNQLVTRFTSSLIEKTITLPQSTHNSEVNTILSGSTNIIITSGSSDEYSGSTSILVENSTLTSLKVTDTPRTSMTFTPIQIETFGESNVPLTDDFLSNPIAANASRVSRSIRFGRILTDTTGSGIDPLLTGSTVSRFRTLVTITEPLGFLHHSSSINIKFNSGSNVVIGPSQSFATNSSDLFSFDSSYDSQTRLVTKYTSSFTGSELGPTPGNGNFWLAKIDGSSVFHEPHGENGEAVAGAQGNSLLYFVVTGSENINTKIEDVLIEVESGSFLTNSGSFVLTSSILYGFTSSILSSDTASKINDTVGINHQFYKNYISQSIVRFRIKAKITEPFGLPQHGTVSASIEPTTATLKHFTNPQSPISFPKMAFNTQSAGKPYTVNESFENINNQFLLVARYTSSFFEMRIPSGVHVITAGTFEADNNTVESTIISQSIVSMSNVSPTKFEDIFYQIESSGLTGSGLNDNNMVANTTRSVLYGNAHITNDGTSSIDTGELWASHPNAQIYASHSVTRFRVQGRMVEPFGPGTTPTTIGINLQANSISEYGDIKFGTASIIPNTNENYTSNKELITIFTSSFISKSIELAEAHYGNQHTFIISGNIKHNPTSSNNFIVNSPTFGELKIIDTPATIIKDIIYETETFGHSGISSTLTTRSVLYGDPHVTNDTSQSKAWEFHNNTLIYASHSVTRFNVKARVIEPLGFLHSTSSFEKTFTSDQYSTESRLNFFTGSSDAADSSSLYDLQSRLVTTYSTSFVGHILSSSNQDGIEYIFTSGSILHEPIGENGFTTESGVSSLILIKDTPSVKINLSKIEIGSGSVADNGGEFDSDSNIPHIIKRIPFGSSTTTGNPNELLEIFHPHSLTRFRFLATITEPLGYSHYSVVLRYNRVNNNTGENTNGSFQTLSTNSSDIPNPQFSYNSVKEFVNIYTSSFMGDNLSPSSPNTYRYHVQNNNITLEDSGTEPDFIRIDNPSNSDLQFIVSSSQLDPLHINDIAVEIESSSFSNIGTSSLTSSLLYGYTASLLSSQTQSFIQNFINGGSSHPLFEQYTSKSLNRFRIKAVITESYGNVINTVSASFSGLETLQGVLAPIDVHTITITGSFSDFNNNQIQTLRSSINLGEINSNFNIAGLKEIRLISMSLRGDLDTDGEIIESVGQFHGLRIGNQEIITSGEAFLPTPTPPLNLTFNSMPFFTILPITARQTDEAGSPAIGTQYIDLEGTTKDISLDSNASLTFPGNLNDITSSIQMIDGIVPITASINNNVGNFMDIEISCSFELVEFGPINTIENKFASPTFSFDNTNLASEGNVFSSSQFVDTFSDNLPRIVSRYTSSWIEFPIPTGSFTFVPAFSSASEGENTFISSFDLSTAQSASITMSSTPPTQIVDISYETEKFGYAGSGSNGENIVLESTRSVLYGNPHITDGGTGSGETGEIWANHPSASIYASHSVTRFRIKGQIIEPFGPAASIVTFNLSASSIIHNDNSVIIPNFTQILTNNPDVDVVNRIYNVNNQLVTTFTTSFSNNIALEVSNSKAVPSLKENFKISGSIDYQVLNIFNSTISPFPGYNEVNISSPSTTSLHIIDTPATQITIKNIETETFGESNIGVRNNDENNPGIISRSIFNGTTTLGTGSGINNILTGSVVTRFRIISNIIEPLGPLHNPVSISLQFNPELNNPNSIVIGHQQIFSTNSFDITASKVYRSSGELEVNYTSSFTGSELSSSRGDENEHGYWEVITSSIDPLTSSGENSSSFSGPNSELYFVVSKSFSSVTVPTVTNLKVEVAKSESFLPTGELDFKNEVTTNVLHGMLSTETDLEKNITYASGSGSLIFTRVVATIEEPPQSIHNELQITIGGHNNDQSEIVISFATNSNDTSSADIITDITSTTGIIGKYTSSFIPIRIDASPNTSNVEGDNAQRVSYLISASIGPLSVDGVVSSVTPVNIPLSDLSHSLVHVTGALSSSTAITLNTASTNISSSVLGDGESESFYYVYNSELGNGVNDTISFAPTLVTTPPTFTTESNLIFDNNLDINYEKTSPGLTTNLDSSNPAMGTASISFNENNLDNLTNPQSILLITKVENTEHGNGINGISSSIIIIPAQPQSIDGDDGILNFDNHGDLGVGKTNLYKATLPTDLGFYKTNETTDRGTVSGIIFITSKSDGTGNNYSMSISTPSSYQGDYGNGNRAYIHGDTGSLSVRINGVEVVNASLKDPFQISDKGGSQDLSQYNAGQWNGGTASFTGGGIEGRLILKSVAPFNGVSQSITHGGINFPNGYQAWNGIIEIDSKIRNGYNKVDVTHSIFPISSENPLGVTHSLNPVEWYYDDGLANPSIDTSKTISASHFDNVTHSLSGVSFFIKNKNFSASTNSNIYANLANKTYRNKTSPIAFVERENFTDSISITADDGNPSSQIQLDFKLDSTANDNGLVLDPNTNTIIPSTDSSGSISNIKVKGTGTISDNSGKGELRNIVIGVFSRNYSEIDTWSEGPKFTTPIGRFIDSSFSDSTLLIENFDKETFRLKSSSISNLYLRGLSSTNLESLLVGDYNSVESIEDLGELQQIAGGILQYPDAVNYNDYSGVTITSPNSVSYTGNLDTNFPNRIYIRAFQFSVLDSNSDQGTFFSNDGGFSQPYSGINRFNVKITTDLSLAELGHNGSNSPDVSTSTVQSGDVSLDGIRIEVRLPGAINAIANSEAQSGTGWGVISNGFYGFGSVGPASGEVFGAFDTDFSNLLTKTGNIINIPVRIPGNYFLHNADGIVVVKVLMHSTFNGSIEKIELESR